MQASKIWVVRIASCNWWWIYQIFHSYFDRKLDIRNIFSGRLYIWSNTQLRNSTLGLLWSDHFILAYTDFLPCSVHICAVNTLWFLKVSPVINTVQGRWYNAWLCTISVLQSQRLRSSPWFAGFPVIASVPNHNSTLIGESSPLRITCLWSHINLIASSIDWSSTVLINPVPRPLQICITYAS